METQHTLPCNVCVGAWSYAVALIVGYGQHYLCLLLYYLDGVEQEALPHPAYRHHVRATRRQRGNR